MISLKTTHNGPTSGFIPYWIGRLWMWFFCWDVVGQVPVGEKFILIAAPHTSNWDFPFGLCALYIYRLKVSWIGKNTLFQKPFGGVMRGLGGIAINRYSRHGVVDQIAKQLRESRKLAIAIAPSGTRKRRDYWKSGFYWIAHQAQVPILCGYLDYGNRKACLGLCFVPTGNVKEDMDRIRDFYKGIQGKYPEMATRIRLRDESK
jgi:1-acyl-sn-glycerol-3-phosphate acyltransferase